MFRINSTMQELIEEHEQIIDFQDLDISQTIQFEQNQSLPVKKEIGIRQPVTLDPDTKMYVFLCPHCELYTEVAINQVNCHIFRHAFHYTMNNGIMELTSQLNPHAPKDICDLLVKENKVIGCAKPFKFVRENDQYFAEVCDYI